MAHLHLDRIVGRQIELLYMVVILKEVYAFFLRLSVVIEQLTVARAQGDLSENADYDAARGKQAEVEARIKEIEATLNNAEILEEKK